MESLKTLVKAQLIDLVKDRNAEVQALRLELSIAKADAAMARGRAAQSAGPAPVVSEYRDYLGRTWIKTRTGNKAVSRLAS